MTTSPGRAERSGFQIAGRAARDYEECLRPIMAPFVDAVVAGAQLRSGAAVLDLACGTGFAARAALAAVGADGRVAGLDVNGAMLALARDAALGSVPPVTWHRGSAGDLPFGADTFDVVLCQQGAQFFPDIDTASKEIARVLRPSGRLLATVWTELSDSPYLAAQYDAIASVIGTEESASYARAFGSSRRVAAALQAAGLHADVEELTFDVVLPPVATFAPGHLRAIPWGTAVAAIPHGVAAVTASMAAALSRHTRSDGSIVAPFRSALIRARRPSSRS